MAKKEVIYRGEDPRKLSSFEIEIDQKIKKFKFKDFKKLTESDFQRLSLDKGISKNIFKEGPDQTFFGIGNLPIYYFEDEDNAIIISHGEEQQGLYSIVLYGIINNSSSKKTYHRIGYLDDKKIMGVPFPQMKDFHNPPSKAIYSDRNYARNHATFIPDEVRMDLFEIKSDAKQTDFISAGYLRSNGFFIRESTYQLLKDLKIPDAKFMESKAFQKNKAEKIYFLNIIESTVIDLKNSIFNISGGIHSPIDENISFNNLEELNKKKKDLVKTPERPALNPLIIKVSSNPIFFKIPGTIDFFISDEIHRLFISNEIIGYEISDASYKLI